MFDRWEYTKKANEIKSKGNRGRDRLLKKICCARHFRKIERKSRHLYINIEQIYSFGYFAREQEAISITIKTHTIKSYAIILKFIRTQVLNKLFL